MPQYTLNIKSWNYVFAFLAATFILSSGVLTVYAAPDSLPTLKLVKLVVTDDGGTAVADEWELFAALPTGDVTFSNQGGSGIFEIVPVNTEITLSESPFPEGYLSSDWSCNGGISTVSNTVVLSFGDRVTCTITSNDIAPTLQLIKEVENPFEGNAKADDWTLFATGSGPDAKRNFSNLGGAGEDKMIFANAVYALTESGDNLAYTAQDGGKWRCTITYPNDTEFTVSRPISAISLKEGDSAVCVITNVQDEPSVSLDVPSRINGKLTVSSEVKGFENTVPVSFKVYKINGSEKSMVYEGYVSSIPYNFSIPAKNLDAGSSYEVIAGADDGKGKSASKSVMVNIPAKGNSG